MKKLNKKSQQLLFEIYLLLLTSLLYFVTQYQEMLLRYLDFSTYNLVLVVGTVILVGSIWFVMDMYVRGIDQFAHSNVYYRSKSYSFGFCRFDVSSMSDASNIKSQKHLDRVVYIQRIFLTPILLTILFALLSFTGFVPFFILLQACVGCVWIIAFVMLLVSLSDLKTDSVVAA